VAVVWPHLPKKEHHITSVSPPPQANDNNDCTQQRMAHNQIGQLPTYSVTTIWMAQEMDIPCHGIGKYFHISLH
jgi:hypothetical protein